MSAPEMSRRQVLAFIALADAPVPEAVRFSDSSDSFELRLGPTAELRTWMAVLGIAVDEYNPRTQWYDRNDHKGTLANAYGPWRGWTANLTAFDEQAPDTPVDDATREQLQELVDEAGRFMDTGEFPAEPGEAGGVS